jgi:hypothetical protein
MNPVTPEEFPIYESIYGEKKCLFERLCWVMYSHVKASHKNCESGDCKYSNMRMDFYKKTCDLYPKEIKRLMDKIEKKIKTEMAMPDKDGFVSVQILELQTIHSKLQKLMNYCMMRLKTQPTEEMLHENPQKKVELKMDPKEAESEYMMHHDACNLHGWQKSVVSRFGWMVVLCSGNKEVLQHYLDEMCILKHCLKKLNKCTKVLNILCEYVKMELQSGSAMQEPQMMDQEMMRQQEMMKQQGMMGQQGMMKQQEMMRQQEMMKQQGMIPQQDTMNQTGGNREYYKNLYLSTRNIKYKAMYKNM